MRLIVVYRSNKYAWVEMHDGNGMRSTRELRSLPGALLRPWALWGRWTFSRVFVMGPSYAGAFTSSNSYKLINSGTRDLLAGLNVRFRKRLGLISSSCGLILRNYRAIPSRCFGDFTKPTCGASSFSPRLP